MKRTKFWICAVLILLALIVCRLTFGDTVLLRPFASLEVVAAESAARPVDWPVQGP